MGRLRALVKRVPGASPVARLIRNDRARITRRVGRVLNGRPSIFFVQIGSNDGRHGDPLYPLVARDPRFSGILIEPVPDIFERLRTTYGPERRFIFVNAAVAEENGTKEFFTVSKAAFEGIPKLPRWVDQLGSFDRSHIVKHLGGIASPFIVSDEIKCRNLDSILREHAVQKIDLVHIDTEGYDYNVLRLLDLSQYRPKVVIYERKHLSDDQQRSAKALLKGSGYRILNYFDDTMAVHPEW